MEAIEKQKLLAYAIKMLERGDSFSDILTYLNKNGADNDLKKEITTKLDEHKKTIVKPEKKLYPVSVVKVVFGLLFFLLTIFLVHIGYIYFPWSIIGYIMGALAIVEIIKMGLNIFKSLHK